jgi:hypothetical protein
LSGQLLIASQIASTTIATMTAPQITDVFFELPLRGESFRA